MHPIKILVSGISVFISLWAPHAFSDQTFSCPYGARAACLNFSDKVVDTNDTCFSPGTCGYEGFICKDKYNNAVREYNELVDSYNEVVGKNKKLVGLAQELTDENQRLADEKQKLAEENQRLAEENQRLANENKALIEKYKRHKR